MERKLLAMIVLILTASLAVCGCVTSTTNTTQSGTQSDKTTFSSNRGYSITYPQAWAKDVNTSANAPIELYLSISPNAIEGVDVGSVKLNATTGTTLDDFFNYNMGNGVTGVSSYQSYALSSLEHTTLAGQPADKVVWRATVPEKVSETNRQLAPLEAMQVYLIHNGTGYAITYKATPSDYDTYLVQAQDVINSFQLT
jgi:ABC-type Fe3+-hydroxamate transport system substrate-binding protein